MLIIGGISRYVDDDKSTKTKFYRRSDVFTFDPKTASTSKLASLPEVRSHHCAVVFDRKVYVIGGATRGDKALNSGLIKIDENWEEIAPMTVPRQGLSCSVFRGRIWACGGRSGSIRFDSCEAYHPTVSSQTQPKSLTQNLANDVTFSGRMEGRVISIRSKVFSPWVNDREGKFRIYKI